MVRGRILPQCTASPFLSMYTRIFFACVCLVVYINACNLIAFLLRNRQDFINSKIFDFLLTRPSLTARWFLSRLLPLLRLSASPLSALLALPRFWYAKMKALKIAWRIGGLRRTSAVSWFGSSALCWTYFLTDGCSQFERRVERSDQLAQKPEWWIHLHLLPVSFSCCWDELLEYFCIIYILTLLLRHGDCDGLHYSTGEAESLKESEDFSPDMDKMFSSVRCSIYE